MRAMRSRSRFSQRRTRARQSRMVWPPTFQPRASHQSRKRRGSMPLPRWPQYSSTSAKLGGVKPEKASRGERATPDCGAASGIISGTRAALPCPASGEKAAFWTAGTAGTAGRTSGEKAAFSTAGARPAEAGSCLEISPFPACPAGVRAAEISCTDASAREESPAWTEGLRLPGFASGSYGAPSPLPCPDSERPAGAAAFAAFARAGSALALVSGSWFLALGALRFDAGRMIPHTPSASC